MADANWKGSNHSSCKVLPCATSCFVANGITVHGDQTHLRPCYAGWDNAPYYLVENSWRLTIPLLSLPVSAQWLMLIMRRYLTSGSVWCLRTPQECDFGIHLATVMGKEIRY
ncbi:hypothetical protein [Bacteroides thetaiotaomicron]|uniref:hypothetical protein n=1 Tax=Bacteroides thetaiotaomicron TaxID=818 RepID=UPI00216568CB|nr:hypothetical protein [Bacteroides thetaiotaomicron]MCS3079954.1 hypothetical protein [Bacteroides thetaiotaomicron]